VTYAVLSEFFGKWFEVTERVNDAYRDLRQG
jgi:hypothetical protein